MHNEIKHEYIYILITLNKEHAPLIFSSHSFNEFIFFIVRKYFRETYERIFNAQNVHICIKFLNLSIFIYSDLYIQILRQEG